MPLDRPAAVRAGRQVGVGNDVEDADAVDPVIVDPPLQRTGIAACRHVRGDDRSGVDPVRFQAQVIGQDLAAGDRQVAVDLHVLQQPAGGGVEPRHPGGARIHRDQDAIRIHLGLPARVQTLDAGAVEIDRGGAQHIADGRPRERPVERHMRLGAIRGQLRHHRAWRQEPRIDLEIAETAVAEVDQAVAIHRQRARSQGEARIGLALGKRGIDRDVELRRGQPLHRPCHIQPRMRVAAHLEGAVARRDRQIGKRLSAQRADRLAVPRLPAAVAGDDEGQRLGHAAHSRNDSVRRRQQFRIDIQLVVVRRGIELQRQPVSADNPLPT